MKKVLSVLFTCYSIYASAQSWQEMIGNPSFSYYEVKAAFDKAQKDVPYQKGHGIKQFYRYERFMLRNMNSAGFYDSKKQEESFKNFTKKSPINNTRTLATPWTQLGPLTPPGESGTNNDGVGRIDVIAFHPTDTNTIYVGAPTGGLWKTVTNGTTWSPLSDTWANPSVSDIFVHPTSPTTIYVATGDRDASNYYATDLLKSTNGGSTWTSLGNFPSSVWKVYRMLINPANTSSILIATNSGIYKSTDEGKTYSTVLDNVNIYDMEFKPGNTAIIYACDNKNLYKSTNSGLTWTTTSMGYDVGRCALAVSANQSSNVYISASSLSRFYGLYKSTNEGANFSKISSPTTAVTKKDQTSPTTIDATLGAQSWYDWTLAVDPKNANNILLGGLSSTYSNNGGTTWFNASTTNFNNSTNAWELGPHVDYHASEYQPVSNKLWVGTDGGVYKQRNSFASTDNLKWDSKNEKLCVFQVYNIGASVDGKMFITGNQDNGASLYKGTAKWDYISVGDVFGNGIDYVNENIMYITYQNGSISRSTDGGKNVKDIFSTAQSGETSPFSSIMQLDPSLTGTLYIAHKNLWKSADYGTTWKSITSTTGVTVGEFEIAPSNSNIIYFCSNAKIYKSINGGTSWTNSAISYSSVTDIEINKNNASIVYFTVNDNVMQSIDGGVNWTSIKYNLPDITSNVIKHVPGTTNELYVGTNYGVYHKADGATTWNLINTGMPVCIVNDLVINNCSRKIIAATYGRGTYEMPITLASTVCCNKKPLIKASTNSVCDNANESISITSGLPAGYSANWYKDNVKVSSTSSNLAITSGGKYNVLITNGTCTSYSSDSIKVTNAGPAITPPLCEKFELSNSTFSFKTVDTYNGPIPFGTVSNVTCTNNGSKMIGFSSYDVTSKGLNDETATAQMISKQIQLNKITNSKLDFDVATVNSYSNHRSNLKIKISSDCGLTYQTIFDKNSDLLTALSNQYQYKYTSWTPSVCTDWQHFTVDLSAYKSSSSIIVFEIGVATGKNYFTNNMFLDNVCISGTLTKSQESTELEATILPNPTKGMVYVPFLNETLVKIINTIGTEYKIQASNGELDLSTLPNGVYIMQWTNEKDVLVSKKIIKE